MAQIFYPKWIFITLSLASFLLWGCAPRQNSLPTSTRSGEVVIETAKAFAEQTRQATAQTPPPTPVPPSSTPTLATATPVATETPATPIVTADYNAFVRNGPDEAFSHIDFFIEGQTAEVIGRYENQFSGTWWYIRRLDEGKDGWVWSGAVTFSGNPDSVPVLDPPPSPIPDD